MRNYIRQATINIFNGTFYDTMEFSPGLNLIGGENGTFKTKLLQQLYTRTGVVTSLPDTTLRIQSINPKRNSERRAAATILNYFRQQNRTFDTFLNERNSRQILDTGFDEYPSLAELFYLVFQDRTKDGREPLQHMQNLAAEFNRVIQAIFQQYSLIAEWNSSVGAPDIRIRKGDGVEFPIDGLSLGEQEILALAAGIYATREKADVYLIDEPEVHLNWHLEERLFNFLDGFCEREQKQAIVVTHSRAMLTNAYLPKVRFLYWEGNKVKWGRELTPEQYRRIAGEAIEIIKLGNFSKPTFFVEDSAHDRFVNALADCYGRSVNVTQCGNSSNVKSLYKLAQYEGGWRNCFFLIDGDNQENSFPKDPQFIQIPFYCSENLLLYPEHLAELYGRSLEDVQSIICATILKRREQILKKNKFLDFLLDRLCPTDMAFQHLQKLDASEIVGDVAVSLGTTVDALTVRMVTHLFHANELDQILPANFIKAFHESNTIDQASGKGRVFPEASFERTEA